MTMTAELCPEFDDNEATTIPCPFPICGDFVRFMAPQKHSKWNTAWTGVSEDVSLSGAVIWESQDFIVIFSSPGDIYKIERTNCPEMVRGKWIDENSRHQLALQEVASDSRKAAGFEAYQAVMWREIKDAIADYPVGSSESLILETALATHLNTGSSEYSNFVFNIEQFLAE